MGGLLEYHLDASPRPVAQVSWDWRECDGCGAVFLGPEGRRQCLCCRLGVGSALPARWSQDEDDVPGELLAAPYDDPEVSPTAEDPDAAPVAPQVAEQRDDVAAAPVPAPVAMEGGDPMAQGVKLPIDGDRLRGMIEAGDGVVLVCRALGVDVAQLVRWCRDRGVSWEALPHSPQCNAVRALQAELDGRPAPPPRPRGRPRRSVAPPAAAPETGRQQKRGIAAAPPAAAGGGVREGGLWFPLRVEGALVRVGAAEVRGAVTEIEGLVALSYLAEHPQRARVPTVDGAGSDGEG